MKFQFTLEGWPPCAAVISNLPYNKLFSLGHKVSLFHSKFHSSFRHFWVLLSLGFREKLVSFALNSGQPFRNRSYIWRRFAQSLLARGRRLVVLLGSPRISKGFRFVIVIQLQRPRPLPVLNAYKLIVSGHTMEGLELFLN